METRSEFSGATTQEESQIWRTSVRKIRRNKTKAEAVHRIFCNILALNIQPPQEVEESVWEGVNHPKVSNYPFKIHIYQESQ